MFALWENCLSLLKNQTSQHNFETWLNPIKAKEINDARIELILPNSFSRDWISENFFSLISDNLYKLTSRHYDIVLSVNSIESGDHEKMGEPVKKTVKKAIPSYYERCLNGRNTFENFVVGGSNEFAHAASYAVANSPGTKYNPLFIYGGTGLGKTHLLHAIGHYLLRRDNLSVYYLSAERFMNELVSSIRFQKTDSFKEKYRNVDMLLIDDIAFLGNKERTQEEFFHTFNSLYETNKQIVISSDSPPKEIPGLQDRLRTRFEWGLIADIQPPSLETRIAILKQKASLENVVLPDDVVFLVASKINSNVRELEGALTRLTAFSSLTKQEINLPMAKEILKDLISTPPVISIERVQKEVSSFFNISVSELKSSRKHKVVTKPRQVAMFLSRKLTEFSFPEIGKAFGNKNHSTVVHACKKIDKQIQEDDDLKTLIDTIINKINS